MPVPQPGFPVNVSSGYIVGKLLYHAPYATIYLLPPLYWKRKGGAYMDIFASFILSVVAGIVTNIICKWFDGQDQR